MADQQQAGAGAPSPKQYFSGIVKQVLDGGLVVIRGPPRNGPPPERTVVISDIEMPKTTRRPNPSTPNPVADEPCSWEAREFLRNMLVGKSVLVNITYKIPNSTREYGTVLVGSNDPDTADNAAVKLVAEGLSKVRDNCQDEDLKNAQVAAQAAKKGMWADDAHTHVRNVVWEVENPRQLVDRMKGKPVKAVIENVRDGSTVRAFLLPDFLYVTVMMSGVRCPSVRLGSDGKPDPNTAEPHSEEAHFFTESRLLQRDVEIVLESANNKNVIGSIIHPNGNIAENLLREGLAKCVDWSLACVTGGPEKYRKAQAEAKAKKLRVWKDYAGPTGPVISAQDKQFSGKVVEIVNGDAIVVKRGKGDYKKIHLASIRPPRLSNEKTEKSERPRGGPGFKPLYDIPFMFESREFLRKKLIGQTVQVTVDYIQPANNDFPEKTCCTVVIGGVNVAEALVSKGLATVVRYSADNDQRSSKYDDLLAAEDKAIKSSKGMHNKKENQIRKIADLSGDVAKSKQFLPFLQRAGKMQAVVEFVASASRFRVYIPRETCVITFLLSGVSCPRGERVMPGGQVVEAEPFGTEALNFVKEMIMQREVEIEVESMDKGGNFIGWCFFGATNLSVNLVEEGFAAAYLMGGEKGGNYANIILKAEENAKHRKVRRWANYVPEEDVAAEVKAKEEDDNDEERKVSYQNIIVTEVSSDGKFFAQHVDEGPKLESLMKQIREEFSNNPPLAGAYQPRRGDTCAAKFVDNQWYRAKVEKVTPSGDVTVLYIDYGNRAVIPKAQCGALPGSFSTLSGFAREYHMALCQLPPDEDYAEQGIKALKEDLLNKKLRLNVEYRVGGNAYVSVVDSEDHDIGRNLVLDGLMMAERRGGKRLHKLVASYQEAMEKAKKNHLNIWQYGDITADDAKEFGLGLK